MGLTGGKIGEHFLEVNRLEETACPVGINATFVMQMLFNHSHRRNIVSSVYNVFY